MVFKPKTSGTDILRDQGTMKSSEFKNYIDKILGWGFDEPVDIHKG